MANFKQITRAEKNSNINRSEMTYLSDMHTLQENNRDLAKLLADKRKENAELKEVEQKFIILENKFKIYRDLHHASLSRLEDMFNKTCSELSVVLDDLALLYTTLKEEQTKADFVLEEEDGCSRKSGGKRLPEALYHMTSVLNEVKQSVVEDSEYSGRCLSPNAKERGNLYSRGSIPDTVHETVEVTSEVQGHDSKSVNEVDKSSPQNQMLEETYHFSLDENFQSFVVDDETIVRKGGGDTTIVMKDLDFHSKQDFAINLAEDILDESIISRRRVSNTDQSTLKDIEDEDYSSSKFRNTKHFPRDRDLDSVSTTSPHSPNELTHTCPSLSYTELKRNRLRNVSTSRIVSVRDASTTLTSESSPRHLQLSSQSPRNSEMNTPHKNLREDKSKNKNKTRKDDIIYLDPQPSKICFQRYRYFFTLCGDSSSSRDMSDAKENVGCSSTQCIQKSLNAPAQLPRKPLQDRKKETIIISNQNIKKGAAQPVAPSSSPEKRSWLRGPRNFDTDVSMPTSYSSFRSMKQSTQETKEREGASKTSKASNKKSRRKPRVKKKENIRL